MRERQLTNEYYLDMTVVVAAWFLNVTTVDARKAIHPIYTCVPGPFLGFWIDGMYATGICW